MGIVDLSLTADSPVSSLRFVDSFVKIISCPQLQETAVTGVCTRVLALLPMNALDSYLALCTQGMTIVADCRDRTEEGLIAAGCSRLEAKELCRLAHTYFGSTAYRRIQAQARRTTHSLHTLFRIEKHVRKIRNAVDRWRLRELLCRTPADHIDKIARTHRPARPAPQPGVTLRRRKDLWSVTVTGKSFQIADLWKNLDKKHPVESLLRGSTPSTVTTSVTITLPQLVQVVQGDGDVELHMANGATMSGKDFVQRTFTQHGFVTLISPITGPVNLYRTSRVANWKQRVMLAAETSTCAWPDCKHPVEDCQIHHIVPWKKGGNTNMDNLAPLCPYHNGVNDDDREGRRGHITRVGGKIVWVPPWSNGVFTDDAASSSPRG